MKTSLTLFTLAACAMTATAAPNYAQPYQQESSTPTSCSSSGCVFRFPAVPAGKRLVITYVSARYYSNDPRYTASFTVSDGGTGHELPANIGVIGVTSTSAPVTYVVEAGKSPNVGLYGANVATTLPQATVTGYLVNVR